MIAALFVLGLLIGSFLNVVVYRTPIILDRQWRRQCDELAGRETSAAPRFDIVVPRSACPACKAPIKAIHNVPVLSWLALRGRCASCKAGISARYPLVELLTGLLSAAVAWKFGYTPQMGAALVLTWFLIALTFIDFDTQLLPDDITLPLLWIGLAFNYFNKFTDLHGAVVGAMLGYLALWTVYWGFKLATGKEGMGYGDFKLLAALGAWFGWQMLPMTILLSSIVGAIVGISLIVFTKHGRNTPIPFGPYLAAAGVIALFWGKPLSQMLLPMT